MTELNFVEISNVFGGSPPPHDIDYWALDDFNRARAEEIMGQFRRRNSIPTF